MSIRHLQVNGMVLLLYPIRADIATGHFTSNVSISREISYSKVVRVPAMDLVGEFQSFPARLKNRNFWN
jgi:hypothetical protein